MMKRHFFGLVVVLLMGANFLVSWKSATPNAVNKSTPNAIINTPKAYFSQYLEDVYNTAQLSSAGLDMAVFQKAVVGFFNLKASNKVPQYSSVLTIIDYSKSSCTKRMWIVDLINKALLVNTWVAHGQTSGDDLANRFSNQIESHASSLGFYVVDEVYMGKHGRSLRLNGMDTGFNHNARTRAVVIHAAWYVSQNAINEMGRLGRSEGCPAVSPKVVHQVIEAMKGKSVLYINGNDDTYTSKYLDENLASNYFYPTNGSNGLFNASL